jgi:hypothetical protein
MDSKLFRLPTSPNLNAHVQRAGAVDVRTIARDQTIPAPDSRFPGWPAPMEDARMVTNYQPHCESNIPAGRQYPTVRWMQRNAESIIDANRTISAYNMGGQYKFDPTVVPPPTEVVSCTKSVCTRDLTGVSGGIGSERKEEVPELFGTYMLRQSLPPESATIKTMIYEGGRNSLRGATVRI